MRPRRRKGLSYILSVVMMTLITTSMAGVVLLWGLNEVGTSRNSFSSAIGSRMDRAQERLTIEDVNFTSPSTATVYIRNIGAIQIVVDQVYIDHSQGTITGSKLSLPIRGLGAVQVTFSAPACSGARTVTVATSRGSTATGYWTC